MTYSEEERTLDPLVTAKSWGTEPEKCTLATAAASFTTIGNCKRVRNIKTLLMLISCFDQPPL